MKKKIYLTVFLILSLILALTSCAGNESANEKTEAPKIQEEVSEKKEPEKTSTEEKSSTEEKTSTEGKKSTEEKENKSLKEKQNRVKGATIGSCTSNYVVDRETFKKLKNQESKTSEEANVHIPKFLIDSEDAKAANGKLQKYEDELVKYYNENYEDYFEEFINSNFSVYQDEKILSVRFILTSYEIQQESCDEIYNFRLSDGKRLNDMELAKIYGVENKIMGFMEESIAKDYERIALIENTYAEESEYTVLSACFFEASSLKDLWENYKKFDRLYLDENGKLKFIYTEYFPAEMGYGISDLFLDAKAQYEDKEISPIYKKMAKELGIEENDEKYNSLIIYLGNGYDLDSIKNVLLKLWNWQENYYEYNTPQLLFKVMQKPENFELALDGQEFYLLVPKYKHAVISLKELKMTDKGEVEEVKDSILEGFSSEGPAVLCLNMSEIFSNAKINIQYRDEIFEFSPYISLKDGSVAIPEEIYNAEKLINEENRIKDFYDNLIYEKILRLIAKG